MLWWFNDIAILKKKFRSYLRRSDKELNSDAYKFGRIKIGSIDKLHFGSKTYAEIYKELEKFTIVSDLYIEESDEADAA